jgi:beta-glucosidase
MWILERDYYDVIVGDSSANTPFRGQFDVKETAWWKGCIVEEASE